MESNHCMPDEIWPGNLCRFIDLELSRAGPRESKTIQNNSDSMYFPATSKKTFKQMTKRKPSRSTPVSRSTSSQARSSSPSSPARSRCAGTPAAGSGSAVRQPIRTSTRATSPTTRSSSSKTPTETDAPTSQQSLPTTCTSR